MMANASSRQIFIKSSLSVATTHGFDGLDLSWFNNNQATAQSDMNNMETFLQEWRQAANEINKDFILTATVPFSPYSNSSMGGIVYPVDSMQQNLNWVHVRTYGYNNPYNSPNFSAASSPLYDPSNKNVNTDYYISQWIGIGFPSSKLVMVLPLFGFSWNLTNPEDDDLGAPANGIGNGPRNNGMISYTEIKSGIQFYGGHLKYNASHVVSYRSQESTWIPFDGVEAIKEKVSYAKNKKLLGYILFEVSADYNWELSLAAKGELEKPGKEDKLKIILATVTAFVLLCGAIIFILWRKKFKRKDIETTESIYGNIPDLQVFSFSSIEEATERFQ